MKSKKKLTISIISTVIVIIAAISLFFIHKSNEIEGTYKYKEWGFALDIEPKGAGYLYEENAMQKTLVPINWKKIKNNTYQINCTIKGEPTTFNASLKNKKLNTQPGQNWSGPTFNKTNDSFQNVKEQIDNENNLTPQHFGKSNTENVWLILENDNEQNGKVPNTDTYISEYILTKNGKYNICTPSYDPKLKTILKNDQSQLINMAENCKEKTGWKNITSTRPFKIPYPNSDDKEPESHPVYFYSTTTNCSFVGTTLDDDSIGLTEMFLVVPTNSPVAAPILHF